jgi:hypothetical protein
MIEFQFKVLSWYFHEETEENYLNSSQGSDCPGQDLNRTPAEFKLRVLAIEPTFFTETVSLSNLRAYKCPHMSFLCPSRKKKHSKSLCV